MWPGMRPATGWIAKLHHHAAVDQQLRTAPRPCAAPARPPCRSRDHDHLLREGHHDARVRGLDRLQRAGRRPRLLPAESSPKPLNSTFAERAVHRLGHQLRQQRAGASRPPMPAMIIAALLEHEALEGDGEAGERVVERDHDRHVGAADRQRHGDAEQQREQRRSRRRSAMLGWPETTIAAPSASVAARISRLKACWPSKRKLRLIRPWSLPKAISEPEKQTAPMNAPRDRERESRPGRDALRCPRARTPCAELDRADRGRGAATHAVVERDHLRHVGHRDELAGPPGEAAEPIAMPASISGIVAHARVERSSPRSRSACRRRPRRCRGAP